MKYTTKVIAGFSLFLSSNITAMIQPSHLTINECTTAACNGNLKTIKELRALHSNILCYAGPKALEIAAFQGHLPVVRWLLNHGLSADTTIVRNIEICKGRYYRSSKSVLETAIIGHEDIHQNNLPIIKELINRKASISEDALEFADLQGKAQVKKYLQKYYKPRRNRTNTL